MQIFSMLFVSTLMLSCSSEADSMKREPGESSEKTEKEEKTDFEEAIGLAEDVIEIGKETIKEVKENQAKKDSVYEASRDNWWVYSIGNKVENVKNLTWQHSQLQHIKGLSIFKTATKKYFLFQKQRSTQEELEGNKSILEEQVGDNQIKVEVIDLVADCSRKKEVVQIDDVKLGKGSSKLLVPCFSCEK